MSHIYHRRANVKSCFSRCSTGKLLGLLTFVQVCLSSMIFEKASSDWRLFGISVIGSMLSGNTTFQFSVAPLTLFRKWKSILWDRGVFWKVHLFMLIHKEAIFLGSKMIDSWIDSIFLVIDVLIQKLSGQISSPCFLNQGGSLVRCDYTRKMLFSRCIVIDSRFFFWKYYQTIASAELKNRNIESLLLFFLLFSLFVLSFVLLTFVDMSAAKSVGFFEFVIVKNRFYTHLMLAGRFCLGDFASGLIGQRKVWAVEFSDRDKAGCDLGVRKSVLVLFEWVFFLMKGAAHGCYYSNLTIYDERTEVYIITLPTTE